MNNDFNEDDVGIDLDTWTGSSYRTGDKVRIIETGEIMEVAAVCDGDEPILLLANDLTDPMSMDTYEEHEVEPVDA